MADLITADVARGNAALLFQRLADMCRPTPRAKPSSEIDLERLAQTRGAISRLRASGSRAAVERARELELALDQIAAV